MIEDNPAGDELQADDTVEELPDTEPIPKSPSMQFRELITPKPSE